MANKQDVGEIYPGFENKSERSHFQNPISSDVDTNPDRYELVENWNKKPGINADIVFPPNADAAAEAALVAYVIANRNFEIAAGTSSTTACVTFAGTVGGLALTTAGASADQVVIVPHLDTAQSAWSNVKWGTENRVIWETVIRTGSSVADIIIWAGLKLTFDQAIAADNDQVYFRFDAGESTWECVDTIGGGGDTETVTDVTVAADTNYYFRIEIDKDRKAHFFIDGTEVHVTEALTDNVNLIPCVGVEASTGSAKHIYSVKQKISREIFEYA